MTEILDGTLFGPDQACFGCAPAHPIGFRLTFTREGDGVFTRMVPGDSYQGPPGIMHGGLVMALCDEIAAWAIIAAVGKFGFTVSVECKLRRAVRIHTEVVGRGRLTKNTPRIVECAVTIHQNDHLCAEAAFKFALLDRRAAEELLGGELPEAWKKFSR